MTERKEGDTPRIAAQRGLRDTVQGTPIFSTSAMDEMQRIVAAGFEFKVGGYKSKQGIIMWVGHVAKDTENERTACISHSLVELLEALVQHAKSAWPELVR